MAAPIDLLGDPLGIVVLSPQPWDGIQVSKHHYARELAALGHRVVFVNPPGGADAVRLRATDVDGIRVVDHPPMPLRRARFRLRPLFDMAARRRAAAIARATGPVDLVWDFDNTRQFADHRAFGAAHSLLHAVDRLEVGDPRTARADLVVTIDAVLVPASRGAAPPLVVGHGLAPHFAAAARERLARPPVRAKDKRVIVGFLGNLAQSAIDQDAVLDLVARRRDAQFRFIGPVQGGGSDVEAWTGRLREQPNSEMTGLLTGAALIEAAADVDIWLLCYDWRLDWNHGINSHKLLEYFATGAEVVSSVIAAQADAPGIFMAPRDAPERLPTLLDDAIAAVLDGRDTGWRLRVERALANSYAENVRRIADRLARR